MISKNEMICVKCNRLMKKVKAGVTVSAESMAGKQHADLWECPGCNHAVITGFAHESGPFNSDHDSIDYYFKRLR